MKDSFIVSYTTKASINDFFEPSNYVYNIKGKIMALDEDGEVYAGEILLYYCDLESAFNNGESAFDVMDSVSESTLDCFNELFNYDTKELNKDTLIALDDENAEYIYNMNILLIDRIEILPKYRGQGLTKKIIEKAITIHGNKTAVITLKVFPLQLEPKELKDPQWEREMQLDQFESDDELATSSLMQYYRNIGFKQIADTRYMVYIEES